MKKNFIYEKNSLYDCKYIISFCTKYKRKILDTNDIQSYLKEIFNNISKEFNFEISNLKILENQVIMEIYCNPTFGINTVITKLKDISATKLKEKFPSLTKRVPCIWTRDSFIKTIGKFEEDDISEFLSLQKKYQSKGE